MSSILFLEFISFLAVGAGILYVAFRARNRNPHLGWLNDYCLYLLFFVLSAFIYRFVPHILEAILRDTIAFSKTYSILANYLVLPLSFLYLLFFVRFSVGLVGLKIVAPFQRAYIVLATIVYLILAARAVGMLKIHTLGPIARQFIFFNWLFIAGLLLLPMWVIVRSRSIKDSSQLRSIRLFATIHCLCLAAYEISVQASGTDVDFAHQLFRLAFNIPPMIILFRLAEQQTKALPQTNEARINSEVLSSRFGITGREQDIIRLVCLGKTNAEIEKELFISVKTVKRHLYNIYQKLGVKNRVQLVNLVRNSGADRASPDA
jgi:DNA-binding CsgD family transcriptional regulator